MRRVRQAGLILLIGAAGFAAGMSMRSPEASKSKPGAVLYYIDPMHPSYKSDKPGTAPDCGMRLEPVYADGSGSAARPRPNAVHITPAQQQLIGLQTGAPRQTAAASTLRTVGRIAVDERRIYRLNSAVDGWIRDSGTAAIGTRVSAGQALASFYAPEFLSAEQAYIFALNALDRFAQSGNETAQQIALTNANIQTNVDTLRNLGMSDRQIEEIRKNRRLSQNIGVYAPTDGFVLARNISPGQRFERGTELFRIADLRRVWVFADVFAGEGNAIHTGQNAHVRSPSGDSIDAAVTDVLPQIDPVTRTIKVRLEVDNRNLTLRPDAFVDVEFDLPARQGLSVPLDAVIDAGTRKVVFIDLGDGYYEPRQVETGWRSADRVEITHGLHGDERIVTSGNFLLDSETRLKLGTTVTSIDAVRDPICGMTVDPERAKNAGLYQRIQDKDYYFCSADCRDNFQRDHKRPAPASARGQHD